MKRQGPAHSLANAKANANRSGNHILSKGSDVEPLFHGGLDSHGTSRAVFVAPRPPHRCLRATSTLSCITRPAPSRRIVAPSTLIPASSGCPLIARSVWRRQAASARQGLVRAGPGLRDDADAQLQWVAHSPQPAATGATMLRCAGLFYYSKAKDLRPYDARWGLAKPAASPCLALVNASSSLLVTSSASLSA